MTNFSKVSKMSKVSKQAIQEAAIYLLKLKTIQNQILAHTLTLIKCQILNLTLTLTVTLTL